MGYSQQDAYKAMQKIYGYKQDWANANTAGDETKKNEAATKVKAYYDSLRDNGYGAQAQKLQNSGLDQSRKYIDNFYAMSGKNAIRPYFYGKAGQYGMTNSDIDKLLSFNETTGEVTFGGKNIGKPHAISSDGISYWDSGDLDNIWNDYVSSSGITKPMSTIAKQGTEDLMGMNKQLFETTMKDHDTINGTNPLDSTVGKQIMEKYGLMGYTGRQNALANGAALNGGNVDSYSAANAMRQQAALNSMGATAAIDAYNSQVQNAGTRLDQARATLQQMGVNINDAVANNETMLNGEVNRSELVKNGEVNRNETVLNGKMNRAAQEADITGVQPRYITNRQNRYFDENGNLKDPAGNNFADIVYALRGELENTKDENRRKEIEQNIEEALAAGNYKVTMPEYSQYATEWARQFPTAGAFTAKPTEDARQFNEQLAQADRMTNAQYQHETDMANLNSELAINEANNAADNTVRINRENTNDSIRASQATNGTGGTSGTNGTNGIKSSSSGGSGNAATEGANLPKGYTVADWVKFFNDEAQEKYRTDAIRQTGIGKYEPVSRFQEHIAYTVLTNENMTYEQKKYILEQLGISDDVINTVTSDRHYN